jgi:hypothetical protein
VEQVAQLIYRVDAVHGRLDLGAMAKARFGRPQ